MSQKKSSGCFVIVIIVVVLGLLKVCLGPKTPVSQNTPHTTNTQNEETKLWQMQTPDAQPAPLAQNLTAKNYYVVIDGSDSMNSSDCAPGSTKINESKKALAAFAKSVGADDNLGLLAFDGAGIKERLPLGSGNLSQFVKQVYTVQPGGMTPLRDALTQAVQNLAAQARRQLGYGEYNLVVVTDGEATPADQNPSAVVTEVLDTSPVVITTIGFCIGNQHSLNQTGRTMYYQASNPAQLEQGLKKVLAEAESFQQQTNQ